MVKITPRQTQCQQKLQARGFSLSGACAMVGNFARESGPNLPTAFRTTHLDHGSEGLPQWRLGRLENYKRFVKNRQPRAGDKELWAFYGNLDMQVDYVVEEMRVDYPALKAKLEQGGDVAALTADVCWQYERPNKLLSGIAERIDYAKALLAAAELTAPSDRQDARKPIPPAGVRVTDHLQVAAATHQTQATGATATATAAGIAFGVGAVNTGFQTLPPWTWLVVAGLALLAVGSAITAMGEARKARNVRQAIGNVTPDAPAAADVDHATVPDMTAKPEPDPYAPSEDERFRARVNAEVAQQLKDLGLLPVGQTKLDTGKLDFIREPSTAQGVKSEDAPVFTIRNADGSVKETS